MAELHVIFLSDSNVSFHCSLEFNQNESINHGFDIVVFAQAWPITYCIAEINEKNVCVLPSHTGLWTIHGIWPNKFKTPGPNFCNGSNTLNISALESIRHDLEKHWPNLHKGIEPNL